MHTTTPIQPSTRRTSIALLAGPAVTFAGMALTPWESEGTTASYQGALAAHPEQAQWAAAALIVGYALMALASLAVLRRAGRAPRTLVGAASVASFCGATVLPGMVSIDLYDLALVQGLDPAQAVTIADAVHAATLAIALRVVAGIGFVLGSLLVLATAWKAGLVGGWAPLLMIGGLIVPGILFPGAAGIIVGSGLTVVAYAGVAWRLRPGGTFGAARFAGLPARETELSEPVVATV